MKSNIIYFISILILGSCTEKSQNNSRVDTLPFYNEATFTPHWLAKNDKSLDTFHRISPFNLTNQDGNIITEKTFKGHLYVVNFFFTSCPGICPKMTFNMMQLQNTFLNKDDVLLLSHSVTPESDSVSVLKEYAKEKGIASDKWHLVTGNQQTIYKLGRHDYFVEEDLGLKKTEDDFLHTENLVLIDKRRHIRGIYNGLSQTSISQLTTDIRTLLKEK